MPSSKPVTVFGPDFPFAYDDWLAHLAGLGTLPADALGTEVAIVGAGMAGLTVHRLIRAARDGSRPAQPSRGFNR